ncbi:MAG: polysaccharide deacetylase family protein [Acidobacteria bacterium]|nr:polysaccharide deacetylase family protein [Acidobacteriota bacterium]
MRFLPLLLLTGVLQAQQVALTFDDGPRTRATPKLTAGERNQALLDHLAKAGAPAALFVTLSNGADTPEGLALLKAWGAAGHRIGNHTLSHPDLNAAGTTLAAYQKELVDCDGVISQIQGYRPWFRFTFLREGNTPEKREGMRSFLKAQGWRNAYVSLDTSDWRLDERLEQVLTRTPKADLTPIREAYVAHVKQRATAYRDLSRRLLGRDIPQVMLMHHNLLNALFLGDVVAMLRAEGWTFVDPEKAFADPVYQLQPERPAPGQSLLLSLARSQGWKLMPEFERLMDDGDFEIAALEKRGY